MAGSIIMPKSGMAMEEGVIIQWLKKEGDRVEKGEPVLEVETDKSTMEVEADYEGVLLKIVRQEGETVPVTEVIGWIGQPGENIPETPAPIPTPYTSESATAAAPEEVSVAPESPSMEKSSSSSTNKVKATPAARRIAREKNIPLSSLKPGGKYGEIHVLDVKTATQINPQTLDSVTGELERVKLTNIQIITGKRMLQSYLEIPSVTVNTEADVTELLAIRKRLNADEEFHFTINDFIIKAAVRALIKNPRMNASLDGDELLLYSNVHLGVAAATPRGLLVPVIRNAETKSLSDISQEMRQIRKKAEKGTLSPDDLTGSTFTISNIGKFGVTSFTPIINQPEAGILGVCAVKDRLARINGEITDRKIMGLSLTFDHRIVDGAESALFIQTLREFLENPIAAII